ncbi:DUF2336 domain-containing protein [Roseibium algae]|uniref:DUF2336 domain-containing protein n=1 Tax=Roseibium algae TaxID=3123038 RepID=A0ABU8TFS6_9HYPH
MEHSNASRNPASLALLNIDCLEIFSNLDNCIITIFYLKLEFMGHLIRTQLLNLARDSSAQARGELMLGLTDAIISGIENRPQSELEVYADISLILYKSAPNQDRVQMSRKVATEPLVPVALAMNIASDRINIALPVLESYTTFGQHDLLQLAEKMDDEHLQVLARRSDLGHQVSNTIVRRGTKNVHRIIAGNREIHLSDLALRALVRHAMQDAVLQEDLSLRTDLTPKICSMLLPHADGAARKRLQVLVKSAMSDEDLAKLNRLRDLRKTHGAKLDHLKQKQLWPYAEANNITLNELVLLMLKDQRLAHVADLLGERTQTPSVIARNAIFSGKMDQVITMAKKAELSLDTFSLLAKARCKQLQLSSDQAGKWINAFIGTSTPSNTPTRKSHGGAFAAKRKERPKRKGPRRLVPI